MCLPRMHCVQPWTRFESMFVFLEDLGQSSLSQLPQYPTSPFLHTISIDAHLPKHFFEGSFSKLIFI